MKSAVYFKLIRWKNLLIIAFTFYILRFHFFNYLKIELNLTLPQFFQLLLSVIFITAAGYIINDIYDIETDKINKPNKLLVSKKISKETAKRWYLFTNTIGLILGISLCLNTSNPSLSLLFITTSLLLYYYSKKLKSVALLGNLIVSLLVTLSFNLLFFFEINLNIKNEANELVIIVFTLLALFSFFLNLIRELVKDIEDVDGDYNVNLKTLPILFGRNRIKKAASYLCLLPLLLLFIVIWKFADIYQITSLYLLLFVVIPLVYVAIKLRSISTKKAFHNISSILKIIMFLGITSIFIFTKFQ